MRMGGLFSGIGGFELAATWAGFDVAFVAEIEPYCCELLAERFPNAPNLGDVTTINWNNAPRVDVLCGGFPCQDISNAGKRAGIGGARSGLWSEYARAIRELRPRFVLVENVATLLGRGIDVVLGDLSTLGYDAEWQVLSAADVGAPHLRERVWIMAHANDQRQLQPQGGLANERGWPGDGGTEIPNTHSGRPHAEPECEPERCGTSDARWHGAQGAVAYRNGRHAQRLFTACDDESDWGESGERPPGLCDGTRADSQWATEPGVGRVAHGVPKRVDRLRGLGNAVVPQCAFPFLEMIAQELQA